MPKQILGCFLGILLLSGCYYDNKEDLYQFVDQSCEVAQATYAADVLPILELNCISCHNNGNPQGGVTLEGYDNCKQHVDNGSLLGSIEHASGYAPMPPGGRLAPCDIQTIKTWIENGAPNN
ncbi:MAG: hypothetical protein D6765_14385 [Bacteroidetes bacterium]|nr:MAG: hypothetical protein D6765_14385 [Bacteroidota bacterium]